MTTRSSSSSGAGPTDEHEARLRAAGVTCVAVVEEAADRHVTLGSFGLEHGWVTTARPRPPRRVPARHRVRHLLASRSVLGPAPTLGEHTDAVVAEFAADARSDEDGRVPSA